MSLRVTLTFAFILLIKSVMAGAQPLPSGLKIVGKAQLQIMWFNIYDAELYNETGHYEELKGPLLLKLKYQRDIAKNKLLSATEKQLLRQGVVSSDVGNWLIILQRIFPDIDSQDTLSFSIDAQDKGYFYHNDHFIGSIDDARFGYAFLNIWLADSSEFPKLAMSLKGKADE